MSRYLICDVSVYNWTYYTDRNHAMQSLEFSSPFQSKLGKPLVKVPEASVAVCCNFILAHFLTTRVMDMSCNVMSICSNFCFISDYPRLVIFNGETFPNELISDHFWSTRTLMYLPSVATILVKTRFIGYLSHTCIILPYHFMVVHTEISS